MGTRPRFEKRMNLRTEECRKRAAECAEKALCAPDQEVQRTAWTVLVVRVAVFVVVYVGRTISREPPIADWEEKEGKSSTFDTFCGGVRVAATVAPE